MSDALLRDKPKICDWCQENRYVCVDGQYYCNKCFAYFRVFTIGGNTCRTLQYDFGKNRMKCVFDRKRKDESVHLK